MKPVIASSFAPSGEAALRIAPTMNQVATAATKETAAPTKTWRRRCCRAPTKLAVIAARIRTASRPSRNTIMPELKTTVPWLMCVPGLGRIGGPGARGRHQVDEQRERGEPRRPPGEAGVVDAALAPA